jgi:hypothetical protein
MQPTVSCCLSALLCSSLLFSSLLLGFTEVVCRCYSAWMTMGFLLLSGARWLDEERMKQTTIVHRMKQFM